MAGSGSSVTGSRISDTEELRNGSVSGTSSAIELPTENSAASELVVNQQQQQRQFGSMDRRSSSGASLRRLFSFPSGVYAQVDENTENEIISQAGDIGDRQFSRRGSKKWSQPFSMDQGIVFPVPEELLESYGFWSHHPSTVNAVSPVSPLTSEIITPISTHALLHEKQDQKEEVKKLPPSLEYVACLIYLALFGILGVLTRFILQKLFGSDVVGVTSDHTILYPDIPSNMVGSFLMGWFGVVFKGDISRVSDQLAIGLSTGYLGSLTTFSGWNQKMLELSVKGHWVLAVLGFGVGLFLSAYSIIFGVETAKGFRWLLNKTGVSPCKWRTNSHKHHLVSLLLLILLWFGLWAACIVLERKDFKKGGDGAQLWLGCLVGPFGVWIRWWLARLNGRGFGKSEAWKWIPFGTLMANVVAASVMAALATMKKALNTKNSETVASGIQLGMMGCLSTVSTFMAEFNAMRQSSHPWRAYAYAILTIGVSFGLGTLIYSVPVWTKGYH